MSLTHPARLLAPISLMAGLYLLSGIPGSSEPPEDDLLGLVFYWTPAELQNLLHIPVYAILASAWWWALAGVRQALLLAIGCTFLYGLFDEWHQSWIPGRFASATDASLNAVGACLGAWWAQRRSDIRAPI